MKAKNLSITALIFVIFFLLVPLVMAHAPLGTGDNESISFSPKAFSSSGATVRLNNLKY